MKHIHYIAFITVSLLYCCPSHSMSPQEQQKALARELLAKKGKNSTNPSVTSSAETSKPLTHYKKLRKAFPRSITVIPAPPPPLAEEEPTTPPPPSETPEALPAYPEENEDIPLPPTDEDIANEELLESAALGKKSIDIVKMRKALENGADVEIKYPQQDRRYPGRYDKFPTPLFTAIGHYHDPVAAELLLLYGADTSVLSDDRDKDYLDVVDSLITTKTPHADLLRKLLKNTREWGGKLPADINDLGIDNIAPTIKTIADVQTFANQETELSTLTTPDDTEVLQRFYSTAEAQNRDEILKELRDIPPAPTDN